MPQIDTVVLTRDATGNAKWSGPISEAGFKVYSLPCIATAPTTSPLPSLRQFHWVVFTSPRAVEYFAAQVHDASQILRIAAIGEATANQSESAGLPVAFVADPPTGDSLGRTLPDVAGSRILVPQADAAASDLIQTLTERGASVTRFELYQTRPRTDADAHLSTLFDSDVRAVVFASPSAVTGFLHRAGGALDQARRTPAVAIGSTTATALTQAGFRHVRVASSPHIEQIIKLL